MGQISTSVFRKATHTGRYLNYRSEHPLQHKRSVVNTLLHRADTICNDEKDRQAEVAIVKTSHIENGYPERMIRYPNKRYESKQNEETRSLAVFPYYPGLTEKLKRLSSHNIKVVSKPIRKIGDILGSTKDPINKNVRQGVIYSIPCHDCQKYYIGETKRCFESRQKEHIADVKHKRFDKSALTRHVFDLGHSMDWQQSKVLEFECDFHKRRFIESYYISIDCSNMNDKSKGVRKGGVLGLTPPLSLIFYKNFITFARRLSVFAYFLLVNLST